MNSSSLKCACGRTAIYCTECHTIFCVKCHTKGYGQTCPRCGEYATATLGERNAESLIRNKVAKWASEPDRYR